MRNTRVRVRLSPSAREHGGAALRRRCGGTHRRRRESKRRCRSGDCRAGTAMAPRATTGSVVTFRRTAVRAVHVRGRRLDDRHHPAGAPRGRFANRRWPPKRSGRCSPRSCSALPSDPCGSVESTLVRRGSSKKLSVPSMSTLPRAWTPAANRPGPMGARITLTSRKAIATASPMATPSSRLRNTTDNDGDGVDREIAGAPGQL